VNNIDMIPFLVMTFFGGIRPDSNGEMSKLEWSNIIGDKVVLRGTQTKTGQKREIPLSENAMVWLALYRARGGDCTGLVVKWTARQTQLRRQKNWKAAGFDHIPQDVARHTFCSHFYEKTGSLKQAMEARGHEQSKVFFRNYKSHVTAEACKEYWAITPPATDANIIPFVKAA
jgi:integrase